jgi:acetyl esterase/lipase
MHLLGASGAKEIIGGGLKKFSFLIAGLLLASFQGGTALSAPNWTVYYDIKYGVTDREKADVYLLNRGVNPVVVFIHGGGWQAGDKSDYAGYYAGIYAMAGFHVVSINYRLASYGDRTTQWNAQLQDVQLAVRWLRQYASILRIDPTRIGAVGGSAGARLALFLGSLDASVSNLSGGTDRSTYFPAQSPKVSAVVDMFGPTDLTQPVIYTWNAPLALFGAGPYSEVPNLYWDASPVHVVTRQTAPTCIVQGASTRPYPPSQSIALRNKLSSLGVPYKWIPFYGRHGFSGLPSWLKTAIDIQALQSISGYLHPNRLNAF